MVIVKPIDLRKAAQGETCMIRSPYCSFDRETTVLAHLRRSHVAGAGMKPPDICGIWACHECHALIDRRIWDESIGPGELKTLEYDALVRQLAEYDRRGWKLCDTR